MGDRTCSIDDCEKVVLARGWCGMHYRRWRVHGDPVQVQDARVCSVEGCEKPHHARGWCGAHYKRWADFGDPDQDIPLRTYNDDVVRFWQKIKKNDDDCWLWTGAINSGGYGHFKIGSRTVSAHRWAYEHFVGPIQDGLEPDHLCRVRSCVNYEHLDVVTRRENVIRGLSVQAMNASKDYCPQGHPYDEENTRFRGGRSPGRICKACDSEYKQRLKKS